MTERSTGTQPFGSLDLYVAPPTLIPRPETEEWTLWLLDQLREDLRRSLKQPEPSELATSDGMPSMTALDLCTGSGCIPLLLSSELPRGTFHALGVDVSSSAIALATRNRNSVLPHPIKDDANTFQAIQKDIFSPEFAPFLRSHPLYPFDVITSNPPYITRKDYAILPKSVKMYEDRRALVGDAPTSALHPASSPTSIHEGENEDTGLAFYSRIASLLQSDPHLLKSSGRLVVEVGSVGGQANDVLKIFERALGERVDDAGIKSDGTGLERVVWAKMK